MGKHWGNSSSEPSSRARTIAVRCASGGLCLSLAVLTFGGFQGLSACAPYSVAAVVPAAGSVGPQTLDPSAPSAVTAAASPAGAPGAVTADPQALVAFNRSTVQTVTREGVGGELNVASASLKRPARGFLMAPLESLVPSSPFGLRTSPLTGMAGEFHWGQDFAAACGTRVYSADAGVVRAVGWHPWGGGNRVEIDHGNGLITTYNHLEAIAVKKGDSVRVGEVIARVGTTGSSTGCHLHFETILNGSHTDPRDWSLIPIKQVDQLGPIEMTSYAPDSDKASNTGLGWAIPVREDLTHVVAGGVEEQPAAVAAKPRASASAAATEAASDKAKATPSAKPTPTGTHTATPTPTGTATPTPTGTHTATPTPTGTTPSPTRTGTTPTPTRTGATATPTPTGTATPSPTGTATPTTTGTDAAKPTTTGTVTSPSTPKPTRTSTQKATAPVSPSVTPVPTATRATASATATEAADRTSAAPAPVTKSAPAPAPVTPSAGTPKPTAAKPTATKVATKVPSTTAPATPTATPSH